MVQTEETTIVVDAGPDFRQQMLRNTPSQLDAIVITHEHNDHIIGLDDVRPFNFRQRKDMPVFATSQVQAELKKRFEYVFATNPYPGAPMVKLEDISKNDSFQIGDIHIQPIEVIHGKLPVLGFRFGEFTYLTDVKTIAEEELEKVYGTKYLVLNALHHSPHFTHLNVEEALALIEKIKPEQAYLTHASHRMGLYETVSKTLPENVILAYDGLQLEAEHK